MIRRLVVQTPERSNDGAGDDADSDEEAGADDGEGGGEQLGLSGGEDGHW